MTSYIRAFELHFKKNMDKGSSPWKQTLMAEQQITIGSLLVWQVREDIKLSYVDLRKC